MEKKMTCLQIELVCDIDRSQRNKENSHKKTL